MIRSFYRHRSGTLLSDLSTDQLQTAARDKQSLIWVDLAGVATDDARAVLSDAFHFHELAVEDVVYDFHLPKVDNYGDYLFLVFHSIVEEGERFDLSTRELNVFLGSNFLVTFHKDEMRAIEALWKEPQRLQEQLMRGPAFLLHYIIDKQIERYLPLLDRFEQQLDVMGSEIFLNDRSEIWQARRSSSDALLNHLLTAKNSTLRLRRILEPQRDTMSRLANNQYAVLPAEATIYYRDLYDHLARLTGLADGMRDLADSTIDTYLALTNNRLNEIMKVLTMISTIFIPLGFVAAVYGMNFEHMPELRPVWSYPLVWLLFLAIAGGLVAYFRRKRWL